MPGEEMDVARKEQNIQDEETYPRRSVRKRRIGMMHRRNKEAARGRHGKKSKRS